MRRPLAILIGAVIVAALAWGGWWWFSAGVRERALQAWLADRRADGWTAEAGGIRRGGFPNRVDIFIDDLALADPEAGWAWSADGFQILSLAYRPQEVIVAWPGEQVVATPLDTLRLTGDVLRASVRFEPSTRLALDRSTLEAGNLQVKADGGWTAGIGQALLATRQAAAGTPFAHDISLEATGIALPDLLGDDLAGGTLPRTIDRLALDATAGFDRPWDRPSVDAGGAILRALDIRDLTLVWGSLKLEAEGRLVADADGRAEGSLDIRARDWRTMLAIAETSGTLDPGVTAAARAGLSLLAGLGGARDELDVTLDFGGGRTRLGPIPLGAAPRLAPPG